MQNTANTVPLQHSQLSSRVHAKLDSITNILNKKLTSIEEELKRAFQNQNDMYHTVNQGHVKHDAWFAAIEK